MEQYILKDTLCNIYIISCFITLLLLLCLNKEINHKHLRTWNAVQNGMTRNSQTDSLKAWNSLNNRSAAHY